MTESVTPSLSDCITWLKSMQRGREGRPAATLEYITKLQDRIAELIQQRNEARAQCDALEEQNAEFLDQVAGGLAADHDCPAIFACAYIYAELIPDSEKVDDI